MPQIDSKQEGDVLVLKFTDAQILDEGKIEEMGDELMKIVEHCEEKKLLLNFAEVQFMSSAVLGKLIKINKICGDREVHLKFCDIAKDLLQVFKITRLDKVFDIQASEAKALAAFAKL
ncbi:MAG: STAS domain-containing protein [Pirellulales bacterium]|nr:STAS domain-containing protein [Pirellulales bacterium]